MKLAILANGPSLPSRADLARVKLPVMGLNRSWKVYPTPDRHVALERYHYEQAPAYHDRLASIGRLYTVRDTTVNVPNGAEWPTGTKILPFGRGTFSTRLEDGIVCELNGVGSVFYAALQVAYALGYRTIYALGLDLFGPHFDDSPASLNVERQNALFVNVPSDLTVLTCGSPASRANFEKVPFSEVC